MGGGGGVGEGEIGGAEGGDGRRGGGGARMGGGVEGEG